MIKKIALILAAFLAASLSFAREKWTEKEAGDWYAKLPYLAGANYIPRDAINQLEMWSADTFNPKMIEQELAWAEALGFNSMRVFLHDLAWKEDPEGFFRRVDEYLKIADSHGIKTMFVIFDSCWNPVVKIGKQPAPIPNVHNSGWVQSPSMEVLCDESQWGYLEDYVKALISRYANDSRVVVWDVYNEPCNTNDKRYGDETPKLDNQRKLLKKVFEWARSANPTQPLTSGIWVGSQFGQLDSGKTMNDIQLPESDVVSFHSYSDAKKNAIIFEYMSKFKRPIFCTEYMARPRSTFNPMLGFYKERNIACYCWGLVNGKTQTIYPWNSWTKKYTPETLKMWHHDILNSDGTPYDKAETDYIKSVLKK